MKKITALLLILMLVFSLTACGDKEKTDEKAFDGSETVELVLPEMFFSGESEEEIIAAAKEEGFQTAKVNDDGTVSVTLTKANQKKLVADFDDEIANTISELTKQADETQAFSGVEHNSDYSQFDVKVNKDKYTEEDNFFTIDFAFLGAWRQLLSGTALDKADTVVNIVDEASGEVLYTDSYKQWMDLFGAFSDASSSEDLGGALSGLLGEDFDLGEWESLLEEEEPVAEIPEMEEQVLLDHDGILMKATGIENGYYGIELKIYIENNSEKAVNVSCDSFLVNDYVFSSWLSEDVAAGKKCNSSVSISNSELIASGQQAIGKIGMIPYLYDNETYERIYTADLVEFETSDYDKIVEDVSGRKELYSGDGVYVALSGYSYDEWWGTNNVELYMENNAGCMLSVDVDDIAVNGFMFSGWGYKTIPDGKKAIVSVSLSESDFESNGIDEVEEIDFSISGMDEDTWDDVFDAGRISVTKADLDACSR
ncbi:MAG: hypothetical protein ILP09_02785 [Oscillospiraceae bacterium]|nr:hypothetical protein [Oscillospiraceae bacterium]